MKIAYINDQLFPCTDTDCEQIMQTVSTMGRTGNNVTLIVPSYKERGFIKPEELAKFYQVELSFSVKCLENTFFNSHLYRFIEKIAHAVLSVLCDEIKKSDIIYTRNVPTVIMALILTRKPVFYETYRNWADQYKFMAWLFRRLNNCKNFKGAVIHSEFAAQSFRKNGMNKDKVLTKMNGYDPERVLPVLSKEVARKKLELPLDRKIVTYSGNVSPGKGLGVVLDLAQANRESLFILVGSKNKTPIEERAEKIENVKIIPWIKFDKVVEYLYASDILVLPPTLDPLKKVGQTVLPIKTFLYMACSRAIFGPASPDLEGILKDNVNAKLVEPDSIEKADAGLKELLTNTELCEKLGNQAFEDIKDCTYLKRSSDIIDFIKKHV